MDNLAEFLPFFVFFCFFCLCTYCFYKHALVLAEPGKEIEITTNKLNYDVLKIWTIFSLSVFIKRVLITKKCVFVFRSVYASL